MRFFIYFAATFIFVPNFTRGRVAGAATLRRLETPFTVINNHR